MAILSNILSCYTIYYDKTHGLEKTLHIENILKKYIKYSHNSTKIGATNIFWGNYLDSKLKLSRY